MTEIDHDFVGYLLGALAPDDQARIESVLADDPAAARRLDLLRLALRPLEIDRDDPPPPDGLVTRTIGLVAEYVVRHDWVGATNTDNKDEFPSSEEWFNPNGAVFDSLPEIPVPNAPKPASATLSPAEQPIAPAGWGRSNVVMALCLGLIVVGVAIPTVLSFQRRAQVASCQNSLRDLYASLTEYASDRGGQFPKIGEPPYNTAGSFVSILDDAGLWSDEIKPCPNVAISTGSPLQRVADSFGYPLGYRDANGILQGIRNDSDSANLPIAGDRPPADLGVWKPTHRSGQNVLYLGGNVRLSSTPNAGINGDAIYTNVDGLVHAGRHRWDTVLGSSTDVP